jgi:hypothetical protein
MRPWPLRALGMAAAGGLAIPGAQAQPGYDVSKDISLCLSYHFGAGHSGALGMGLEGRLMTPTREGHWSPSVGIGARLALVGVSQVRLVATPQLVMVNDQDGIGVELGFGARFGRETGTLFEPGLRGDYRNGQARLTVAREESLRWSVGLGGRLHDVGSVNADKQYQPGRPLRTASGHRAPLPALCFLDRNAEGRRWADRARLEWCSIPAFGELHDQLRTSGAPRELQARALQAADDELRHAIDAARVASLLTGAPIALDPPARSRRPPLTGSAGLHRLVDESWVDGCLGEGAAAREADLEARHSPTARAELLQVAADEQRHAELAWDVLRFALAADAAATRRLLASAAHPAGPDPWRQQAQQRLQALLAA